MSPTAAVAYLVDYEGRPDDVDARIGRPDHAQVDHERPLRARHRHRRRAPALDVPHDPHAAPAAGEDGAVLAQPLRHRLQQAGRRLRRDAGGQDARAQARRAARAAGTDRAVPPVRARQLPRPPGAGGAGSRDAGVARRQEQHQGEAAGELRPRDHGAVHGRRRPLHRAGRLRRGACVHRLEPAAVRRTTARTSTAT